MKKNLKKVLSLAFAGALAATAVVPTVGTTTVKAAGDTIAYLTFADNAWGDAQYWNDGGDWVVEATTADVTGYGQYTVGLDFSGTEAGKAADMAFLDVEIANGEEAYPDSYMTIDSVKINGEEVEVGATYTNSDDGVATRTNLYNSWVSSVDEGRTADGELGDATATPIDGASITDIETIEVTFTLGDGVAFGAAASGTTEAKELPEEGTIAYISVANNDWTTQYFNGGDSNTDGIKVEEATINASEGQFTTSIDFTGTETGVLSDIGFLDVEIAGGEEYFPNCFMTIDSVKINGEEVDLGATYTNSDDGIATRTNLYNAWVDAVTEGRTADGEVGDATATPVDGASYTDIETIEVTFTLGAGVAFGGSDEETTDASDGFTAFLMFADGSGAWENYDQGVGTECTVLGDGVYEVSLTAEQCGATGQAAASEDACVFLVDIVDLAKVLEDSGVLTENDDEKMIVSDIQTKVAVFVDGKQINAKSKNIVTGDIEEKGTFRIDLFNAYDGAGTKENPVVSLDDLDPSSEIKVVFSLSGTGLNSDADTDLDAYLVANGYVEAADTEAPDTETTTETVSEGGLSTGAIVGIVVAVVVVAAVVVVVVVKKKKGNN